MAASLAQISQPAARGLPFLGRMAVGFSFLTRNLLAVFFCFSLPQIIFVSLQIQLYLKCQKAGNQIQIILLALRSLSFLFVWAPFFNHLQLELCNNFLFFLCPGLDQILVNYRKLPIICANLYKTKRQSSVQLTKIQINSHIKKFVYRRQAKAPSKKIILKNCLLCTSAYLSPTHIRNPIQKLQQLLQMAKNLLLIEPYSHRFYDIVIYNLQNAFNKQDISNIEVQFKYALPRYFHLNYSENQFKDIAPALRRRVEDVLMRQADQFLRSVKVLSSQAVLLLNPLGKHNYSLISGFNQFHFKKFYHIRELFSKMCTYNETAEYKHHEIKKQPFNMYQQFANSNQNHTLRMVQDNEIRLDLYIREMAPQPLQGRYSYTSKEGWKKTVKEPLCMQMDYAFAEQLFRMAINKEVQVEVPEKDMEQIAKICKSTSKAFDIRLKRQMRVRKGNLFQFTFSQIYNINDLKVCTDVAELMAENKAAFDRFIRKLFINFFSASQKEQRALTFELELQYTKQTNSRLKRLLSDRRYDQVKRQLANVIEELMVIFYADHTTKIKEQPWMNYLVPQVVTQGRLQNQYGTHMRQRLYRLMQQNIDPALKRKPSSQNMFKQ